MSTYLLCAYRDEFCSDFNKPLIIGNYKTMEEAKKNQEIFFGREKRCGKGWLGRTSVYSWIHELKKGTLKIALSI